MVLFKIVCRRVSMVAHDIVGPWEHVNEISRHDGLPHLLT